MNLYVELGLHTNASAVTDKNGQRYRLGLGLGLGLGLR